MISDEEYDPNEDLEFPIQFKFKFANFSTKNNDESELISCKSKCLKHTKSVSFRD